MRPLAHTPRNLTGGTRKSRLLRRMRKWGGESVLGNIGKYSLLFMFLVAASGQDAFAQGTKISVDQAECLPIADNGLITSTVQNEPGGSTVRIYFRRLHEVVEDFYWVQARPAGSGRYWAVLPEAEDEMLEEHRFERGDDSSQVDDGWADWWREKQNQDDRDPNGDLDDELIRERASRGKTEKRDWLEALDDATLQQWLETLDNEPTEYFGAVYDASGKRIARSEMKVVEVREDCQVELTEQQRGEADNLTVGETAEWAEGERVFHWLCDGIVTRIGPDGVPRTDELCRACIVAWWQKKELLVPALLVPPTIVISGRNPQPISPSTP